MRSMRALAVLVSIAGALAAGTAGAFFGSSRLFAVLVVGALTALGAVLHLVKRGIGHDIWRFEAPYPYQSMRNQADGDVRPDSRQPAKVSASAPIPDVWEHSAAA